MGDPFFVLASVELGGVSPTVQEEPGRTLQAHRGQCGSALDSVLSSKGL